MPAAAILAPPIAGGLLRWGRDGLRQIGDSQGGTSNVPVGVAHACAATADGRVWRRGFDNFGQLGNGTEVESPPAPAKVVVSDAIFADGFEADAF